MKSLIIFDADSIIWTVAYKFRNKKLKQMVLVSLNKFIDDVIKNTKATHYLGFYGSKEEDRIPNFRYAIDTSYKGHRPEEPDWLVKWRPIIHQEMTDKWGFIPVDGMEADDACSIAVEECREDYDEIIAATADKDLLQIPNIKYYNYTKHTSVETDDLSAVKALTKQMLVGDSADNIKGLYKIGPVIAGRMLENCDNSTSLWWTVVRAYIEKESELRDKAIKSITKTVKAEFEESDWANNKTAKQIERKVRLTTTSKIDAHVNQYMPGGWKTYYKNQYNLLALLTKSPDGWSVPDAKEYEYAEIDTGIKITDDFLYKI